MTVTFPLVLARVLSVPFTIWSWYHVSYLCIEFWPDGWAELWWGVPTAILMGIWIIISCGVPAYLFLERKIDFTIPTNVQRPT